MTIAYYIFMARQRKWLKEEEDFLKENCGILYIKYLADKLGRSYQSVKRKCDRLGIDTIVQRYRLAPGEREHKEFYRSYIGGAKKRGISFELSEGEFREIVAKNCYYCDSIPSAKNSLLYADGTRNKKNSDTTEKFAKLGTIFVNGIDRIDSKLGYVKSNCIPCCKVCNQMKMEKDIDLFLSQVRKIANFRK